MIKYAVTLVLVDVDERELQLKVAGETPEEAALKAFARADDSIYRRPEIGDCVQVSNPNGAFTGFYIYDKDGRLKQINKAEFLIWRTMMKANPLRKEGFNKAMGIE